jgi:hypothetical protein
MCQLPGEPVLVPARLQAMDGNNSMKRVNGWGHSDDRVFISNYLIPPSHVDLFKDDVQTRPGLAQSPSSPASTEEISCTKRWVVANTVSEGTVEVFQQTGGFISACRHAIIQTFAEMRNSGEL